MFCLLRGEKGGLRHVVESMEVVERGRHTLDTGERREGGERQKMGGLLPELHFKFILKKRSCPPRVLEGLRVGRPWQCWECLEAKACRRRRGSGAGGQLCLHPQTSKSEQRQVGVYRRWWWWWTEIQLLMNQKLFINQIFPNYCFFIFTTHLWSLASQPFQIWVWPPILVQLAHLSLSLAQLVFASAENVEHFLLAGNFYPRICG